MYVLEVPSILIACSATNMTACLLKKDVLCGQPLRLRERMAPEPLSGSVVFTSTLAATLEAAGETLCYSREDANDQETLGKVLY